MPLLKKSSFAKISSSKDSTQTEGFSISIKEKQKSLLERPSPSTFPSRSRRRIPLSKTAAYNWLGVQGTMEQAPAAAEFKTREPSKLSKRTKSLSESDARQVAGNGLPKASSVSESRKISVVIPEGCVPKAGILITVTSPSGATSGGFCDMEENSQIRPKRLLEDRVNK
ncbi:hypothetical protein VTN00DRAFT_4804 [Thermoascus crustaceus]|uniref:uncharacterized protein n=1 Tax=Thermoascus crustaceus TaxID=5088 RepID=UPI0037426F17